MIFLNSDIKSHNVHFTFAMTRSWFCSKGSRKTKKTPLWPGALFATFFCSAHQDKSHMAERTRWLNRPCSVWNPPDRRLWFSRAVMSTLPVLPGRGPTGWFVHNQGFPGLHRELQPLVLSSVPLYLWECKWEGIRKKWNTFLKGTRWCGPHFGDC